MYVCLEFLCNTWGDYIIYFMETATVKAETTTRAGHGYLEGSRRSSRYPWTGIQHARTSARTHME